MGMITDKIRGYTDYDELGQGINHSRKALTAVTGEGNSVQGVDAT